MKLNAKELVKFGWRASNSVSSLVYTETRVTENFGNLVVTTSFVDSQIKEVDGNAKLNIAHAATLSFTRSDFIKAAESVMHRVGRSKTKTTEIAGLIYITSATTYKIETPANIQSVATSATNEHLLFVKHYRDAIHYAFAEHMNKR